MNVDDPDWYHLCISLRQEELEVLESIYPDYIAGYTSGDVLKLDIPVELGLSRPIEVYVPHNSESASRHQVSQTRLAHLPPLLLSITFPVDYPLKSPPSISSIHPTHSWLPHVQQLTEILLRAWSAGEGTLCNWVEYIRNGDMLDDLGLVDSSGTIR